ncbi:MAG TPA: ribose-phosphate diphosphokinase [Hydrogenophaga sp.]|mgnify:CR=1 FL=1|uniref:ribose-phosphate diphosphokinase n=1 Tax=Hydrogenophaga sp. TaxID=1904254 RepID=UPI002B6658C1|nr:ribose-phosphate diphosphokinase [Hydrogenophaga sp.]HMN91815.1 ribose-phosphate diphosphokinase [Hydrogenophaga sp.]HMP10728.1 ribose-phosphate diphosphokinase [Hydrogenophaga sp.]
MQPTRETGGALLYVPEEQALATAVASSAGLAALAIERHRFPDGELRLCLPPALPARVVVWRGLHQPNEKLVELLLVAQTARDLGAQELTLVAPYLGYMRQDMAFRPGEAVSQRIVGRFLAGLFDAVITVDPHLHRVATLQEAVPVARAVVLSGAPLLAEHIARVRGPVVLLGPDEESLQWVASAARLHGWKHAVCHKTRHGDREVDIVLPKMALAGEAVVLIDDVASSGQTLVRAAELLKAAGARSVDVAVTHALLEEAALARIHQAGVGAFWSTDAVAHPTNAVSIANAVAGALRG